MAVGSAPALAVEEFEAAGGFLLPEDGARSPPPPRPRRAALAAAAAAVLAAAGLLAVAATGSRGERGTAVAQAVLEPQELLGLQEVQTFDVGHLMNKFTGLCLDWKNIIITQTPCSSVMKEQRWAHSPAAKRFTSTDFRCLDSSGKYPHVWSCASHHKAQDWEFDAAMGHLVQDTPKGVLCLSATSAGINMASCDRFSASQKWEFRDVANGKPVPSQANPIDLLFNVPLGSVVGHIQNEHTGLCLHSGAIIVTNMGCEPWEAGQVWVYNHHNRTITTHSHRCMDSGGKYVHVWECHSNNKLRAYQHFNFDTDTGLIMHSTKDGIFCLTANRTAITVQWCNAQNKLQRWKLASIFPLVPQTTTATSTTPPPPPVPSATDNNLVMLEEKKKGLKSALAKVNPVDKLLKEAWPEGSVAGHIQNEHTGLCLTWKTFFVTNTACDPWEEGQVWVYNRHRRTITDHTRRCMDSGGKFLHVWQCKPELGLTQHWNFDTDTGLIMQSTADGILCLTANSTLLSNQWCNPDNTLQRWKLASMFADTQQPPVALPQADSPQALGGTPSDSKDFIMMHHLPPQVLAPR